jgi:hypothetical protein
MWPELWLFLVVPMLAVVPILDAALGVSQVIAFQFHFRWRENVLLGALIVIAGVIVFMMLPIISQIRPGMVDYATVVDLNHALARRKIELWFVVGELTCVAGSLVVALWLSARQKRQWAMWIPLGIIGNIGAVIWLIANRKQAVSKTSNGGKR